MGYCPATEITPRRPAQMIVEGLDLAAVQRFFDAAVPEVREVREVRAAERRAVTRRPIQPDLPAHRWALHLGAAPAPTGRADPLGARHGP